MEETAQTKGIEELDIVHTEGTAGAGTNTVSKGEIESKLNQLMEAWARRGQLAGKRSDTGRNSRDRKDPGVDHPPRNRVKMDWESEDTQNMYEGAG